MLKALILLLGICLSSCGLIKNGMRFVPMKGHSTSCFIEKGKEFGELKITIENISAKRISFSKPRVLTVKDFSDNEPAFVNALKVVLDNKEGKVFEMLAFSYNEEEIINELITLEPNQKTYSRLYIRDFAVERRCNLIPFSDLFEKGKEEFEATLSIICIGQEQANEVVTSNSIPFVKLRRK